MIKEVKLSTMPYAQAKIITNGRFYQLWSYKTCAAYIDSEGWLHINGLYSMTTRKHISAFMREYVPGGTYQLAKWLFQTNQILNVNTGELLDR